MPYLERRIEQRNHSNKGRKPFPEYCLTRRERKRAKKLPDFDSQSKSGDKDSLGTSPSSTVIKVGTAEFTPWELTTSIGQVNSTISDSEGGFTRGDSSFDPNITPVAARTAVSRPTAPVVDNRAPHNKKTYRGASRGDKLLYGTVGGATVFLCMAAGYVAQNFDQVRNSLNFLFGRKAGDNQPAEVVNETVESENTTATSTSTSSPTPSLTPSPTASSSPTLAPTLTARPTLTLVPSLVPSSTATATATSTPVLRDSIFGATRAEMTDNNFQAERDNLRAAFLSIQEMRAQAPHFADLNGANAALTNWMNPLDRENPDRFDPNQREEAGHQFGVEDFDNVFSVQDIAENAHLYTPRNLIEKDMEDGIRNWIMYGPGDARDVAALILAVNELYEENPSLLTGEHGVVRPFSDIWNDQSLFTVLRQKQLRILSENQERFIGPAEAVPDDLSKKIPSEFWTRDEFESCDAFMTGGDRRDEQHQEIRTVWHVLGEENNHTTASVQTEQIIWSAASDGEIVDEDSFTARWIDDEGYNPQAAVVQEIRPCGEEVAVPQAPTEAPPKVAPQAPEQLPSVPPPTLVYPTPTGVVTIPAPSNTPYATVTAQNPEPSPTPGIPQNTEEPDLPSGQTPAPSPTSQPGPTSTPFGGSVTNERQGNDGLGGFLAFLGTLLFGGAGVIAQNADKHKKYKRHKRI